MGALFKQILVEPLLYVLTFLYNTVAFGDFGIAVILLTLLVRVVLHPLFYKSLKQQAAMRKIQPHIERIQTEHKNDREAQGKALLALYKEHGVNPFSSFGLLLIQLPILIALYQAFLNPPPGLDYTLFNLINLEERSIIVVGIAAITQLILGWLSIGGSQAVKDPRAALARNMVFIGPVITVVVLYTLPAAIGIYWVTTTLFSIAQQLYINKTFFNGSDTTNTPKVIGINGPQRTGS